MRCLLIALGLIASIGGASAQEFELPTLRGSDIFTPAAPSQCCTQWEGFYVGGQLGYGYSSHDFSQATQPLIALMLRETVLENEQQPSIWQVLGKTDVRGASGGGFFGYNSHWESLILGLELNYSRTDLSATAPILPIERVVSAGGYNYDVFLNGQAAMQITDLATLRARAGWEASANFLPYAMIGVAAGRANISLTAVTSGTQTSMTVPPVVFPFFFTQSQVKNGAFLYGWSVGAGIDILVMPHVFLRAEYEYVAFSPIWNITANINTARLALGFKF